MDRNGKKLGRICIPRIFLAGEMGYFVDWFIYAVKDTLLSGVQGSFDKLRGSPSFEFFNHFSSVSRYWFRVIAFKDRGGT